jgi:hypothetical protein
VGVLLVGVTVVAGMTCSADGVADRVVSPIAGVGSGLADRLGPQLPVVPSTVAVATTRSNPLATATPAAENVMATKAMTMVRRKVRMCMPFRAWFPASRAILGIEHCGLVSVPLELVDAAHRLSRSQAFEPFSFTLHVDSVTFSVTNINMRRQIVINAHKFALKLTTYVLCVTAPG